MGNVATIKDFNYDNFINSYILKRQEYSLMDYKSRMIYAKRVFGYMTDMVYPIGRHVIFNGYMHPCYYEFFELMGCVCKPSSTGLERFILKRVSNPKPFEYTEEDEIHLNNHIYNIAKTKADIIKRHLYHPDVDNSDLSMDNFYYSLSEELKYAYADSLYGRLIDTFEMSIGEVRYLNFDLPNYFDSYFNKRGFNIKRMNDGEQDVTLCVKTGLSKKAEISINTLQELSRLLIEREMNIKNVLNQSNNFFSKNYINQIKNSVSEAIQNVDELGGISSSELTSILKAECAMLKDILNKGDCIKLDYVTTMYQAYLDSINCMVSPVKPYTYKLEIKQ